MNRWVRIARQAIANPGRFAQRIQNEALSPSSRLVTGARAVYTAVVPNRSLFLHANENRLLFVYDTLPNPVTYDFIHYLYQADWMRRELGKTHLDVLLVSRKNIEASREAHYVAAIGSDNVDWRVANILMPLCRLFPAVSRVSLLDSQEAFEVVDGYRHVQPEGYGYRNPKGATCRLDAPRLTFAPVLTVSKTASSVVDSYFPTADERKIVTITLRTYGYLEKRNSNIAAWVQFARSLDSKKYRPLFVPDASIHGVGTLPALHGCEVFDHACWNLELRAAIYQRAWMNAGVACGPLGISCFMADPITLMLFDPASFPADYKDAYYKSTGLIPGRDPPFYSPRAKFHHGTDDYKTIRQAFDEYGE